MKKLLNGLLITVFVVSGPSLALAETATSTSVQALLDQLKTLQTQIAALTSAQNTVEVAKSDVLGTLKLIRGLKQGMSGEDVSALQAILAADPETYPEGLITGFYGQLTAKAVKSFQKKHGIEAVGFVGPKTLQKLNQESESLGLTEEDGEEGGNMKKKLCAKVPPGHLIAKGWLKKNGGVAPIVPACQKLPPGILKKLSSTTPSTSSSTAALSISKLRAENVSSTSASVLWNTKTPSTSVVWFSTSTPVTTASSTSVSSSAMVTSHSLLLSGLATSTTYYYVAISSNSSSTATSTQKSFKTLNQ
ncbi:MAG: peptidoglycan-binding protein [bacterium]|nr:peptidoglycan-binding protein [bacterium]